MDINLTNQAARAAVIGSRLVELKGMMDQRKAVWDRISLEKKKLWIQHAETHDPIMNAFYQILKYAQANYPDLYDFLGRG